MKNRKLMKNILVVAMSAAAGIAVGFSTLATAELKSTDYEVARSSNYLPMEKAIKKVFGENVIQANDGIKITAPKIAEEGPEVPIKVFPKLENVEEVTIFASGNQNPLIARYKMPKGVSMVVGARIKLRQDSNVVAVVKADGKLYKTTKLIKVTKGGCGG